MSEKLLTIEFEELHSCKSIKGKQFVFIVKDGKEKKYKVIDTKEKLSEYSLNMMNYLEKELGLLVICKCNNISGSFRNVIFLEEFKVDYCCNPQIDDFLYLNFQQCHFFQKIELMGGNYQEVIINNSSFQNDFFTRGSEFGSLFCTNNRFEKDMIVMNCTIEKSNTNTSKFDGNLFFDEVNILNDFTLDKIKVNNKFNFTDCRFSGVSKFNKLEIENGGELNFSHCSFYKMSEINFDIILGKLSIYKTNFTDKCYLEYEQLENKKYKPLINKSDFKKTKWNFFNVADIYKSNGKTEQYLETFYYFKKYERLERKSNHTWRISLLDYLIEITTKYYTSWKRILLSMGVIITIFFLLYCSFPNLLIYKDNPISSKSLFVIVSEMVKNSNLDIACLISKFGNTLYFTIITFTTVGYGDITPLNWMKAVASLESLLGIFFTSSFVVTLSRKFLG
ncbi:two pore domain potassium channel family protein [Clostridium estertheticum]|uniref:potassium channel family protein n=1 Tax=Clostridium estertheticum TaxID=238834 RepID=UPI001C0BBD96|nr:potassium channel family protein [Clostridium estertheticum]MBU3198163.1 two pore domain potassium channel family protein [Clostridium estertheticum]WAG65954.1 two pore domain potassium channel family protein [Clostridium estertheticum]